MAAQRPSKLVAVTSSGVKPMPTGPPADVVAVVPIGDGDD
eukprot:CAMPEP_0172692392 /NCGR_PEP_ID=MMETSP1074-20121228/25220_1 /TAXON_ID=2916 /ORGANISM="Ceratium fusus, Strain PA161109" /LENGTH=39 /DNA_ID= /DNA_START= /DNA_END= /DNA_ORIENTATION=